MLMQLWYLNCFAWWSHYFHLHPSWWPLGDGCGDMRSTWITYVLLSQILTWLKVPCSQNLGIFCKLLKKFIFENLSIYFIATNISNLYFLPICLWWPSIFVFGWRRGGGTQRVSRNPTLDTWHSSKSCQPWMKETLLLQY